MSTKPGSRALLDSPLARQLLHSSEPAQLAYTSTDGTPRAVPISFPWTGSAIVVASPSSAPKVQVLQHNPAVALTINTNTPPYKALLVRRRCGDCHLPVGRHERREFRRHQRHRDLHLW